MNKFLVLLILLFTGSFIFDQSDFDENLLVEFDVTYKSDNFEKDYLAIDEEVQSDVLSQPFQDRNTEDVTIVNALTDLSKEQAELIFSKTKVFPNQTQLSIAFIENGTIKFYGVIKENDTIRFVNNKDRVFEVGSISKVFTSTLLAQSILEKKINLNDKINKYYDFPFNNNLEIDFRSLANHTSGLERLPSNLNLTAANSNNPYKDYDQQKLYTYLKDEVKLNHEAGEEYEYSNLGTGLLGYTLGLLQNSNYEKLLQDKIFKKYEMVSSFTNKIKAENRLVKGLDANGKEVDNWDFDVLSGAGGILSTVTDLSKFIIAQFNSKNKALALARVPTFTVNEKMKIGLGWHIIKTESEKEVYWHNGGTGGYSSSVTMDTESKTGIIILSNVSAFNPNSKNIDNVCFELMKLFRF